MGFLLGLYQEVLIFFNFQPVIDLLRLPLMDSGDGVQAVLEGSAESVARGLPS